MNTVSTFLLLWIVLLWTCRYLYLFEYLSSGYTPKNGNLLKFLPKNFKHEFMSANACQKLSEEKYYSRQVFKLQFLMQNSLSNSWPQILTCKNIKRQKCCGWVRQGGQELREISLRAPPPTDPKSHSDLLDSGQRFWCAAADAPSSRSRSPARKLKVWTLLLPGTLLSKSRTWVLVLRLPWEIR